ncbi:Uncharacterised protein [Agrobacterium tumefaciens]|nr:Uncharacterised protein [Agrobacterium tumefaciens]
MMPDPMNNRSPNRVSPVSIPGRKMKFSNPIMIAAIPASRAFETVSLKTMRDSTKEKKTIEAGQRAAAWAAGA